MAEVRVVVITGAGASCALGDEAPMPLMNTWPTSLRDDLEAALGGSARVLGLDEEMTGEGFEDALGPFLQWQRSFHLNRKFRDFGGPSVGSHQGDVERWLDFNDTRGELVVETLRANLYRNFGRRAVSESKALAAWQQMDRALGGRKTRKFFATTNYDPSLELAFNLMQYQPDDGFRRRLPVATPYFDATGIGTWKDEESRVVVLHLHGAVGWYRGADGRILYQAPDQNYNPTLGTPVILLPDPQKDPFIDADVSTIWSELTGAVREATHVLVIGHSLHDSALLRLLSGRSTQRLAVLSPDANLYPEEITKMANILMTDFGPDGDVSGVAEWLRSELGSRH
jgi:hypothetical protein